MPVATPRRITIVRRITIGLLVGGPVVYIAWDEYVYHRVSNDATISIVLRDWGVIVPALIMGTCFTLGVFCGHWWVPIRPRPVPPPGGPPMADVSDSVSMTVVPPPAPQSLWQRFLAIGVAARTHAVAGDLSWVGPLLHWDAVKASIASGQVGAALAVVVGVLHTIAVNTPKIVESLASFGVSPEVLDAISATAVVAGGLGAGLGKLAALKYQGPVVTLDPADPAPQVVPSAVAK